MYLIKWKIGEKMNINEELVKEIGSIMKLEFTDAQMDTLVNMK